MSAQQNATKSAMFGVLFAISLVHLFNDALQAVIPASFPILKESLQLSFAQLGFITFMLNLTSSVLQPFVGMYTDKYPKPYLLPLSMVASLAGMIALAFAPSYSWILLSVVLVGLGSAVFHPGASRVAHMAAGPRRGLAQSIYQVGGNGGQALAPILALITIYPFGQRGSLWFTLAAAAGCAVLLYITAKYKGQLATGRKKATTAKTSNPSGQRRKIVMAVTLVVLLIFGRSWYGAGITNYFIFYLAEAYHLSASAAQVYIFVYLGAGAVGTFLGGPVADRFGRKTVLFALLISLPFTLILPYAGPMWSYPLLAIIGFIQMSSFSVAVVYVLELIPGRVGTMSGLITGLAFGMGGLGSVALGGLIDATNLSFVIKLTSFLPLLGLLTLALPSDRKFAKEA
ncbi:MFS transporter [Paenibacillus qinlingensis]|uniref:FSR family fosmidomycin resistance protein-like MFS transporter n=1 Tax=Paenibacillus qinlingensis TaxID=1837343 RepID=A0ABU1NYE3_9BACL|nr:MFS transporter [Paenibacillus qinlingensis]MDR6552523.1 FSR family fosmidomycin resistance protein-like MFS transporter [Paenibacillus qinlingensis]